MLRGVSEVKVLVKCCVGVFEDVFGERLSGAAFDLLDMAVGRAGGTESLFRPLRQLSMKFVGECIGHVENPVDVWMVATGIF